MEPIKRVLDAETERKLRECLPFEEGEHAEVTFSTFAKLPEEVRPYFFVKPLSFEQRSAVNEQLFTKKSVPLDLITKVLKEGVLVGWKNYRTRSRMDEIPFSVDEIESIDPHYRDSLFWKAYGFNNPNAIEREGLES
jgi:hypothetical protein